MKDELAAFRRGSAPRTPAGFGYQVRTYVLAPHTLVKDLRTGLETSNAQAVLDGDLDAFMEASLEWLATKPPADPNVAVLD